MSPSTTIPSTDSTMKKHGLKWAFFGDIPLKKDNNAVLGSRCVVECYNDFRYCSFNGKEKDCESGFHYYGARYYWSEMLTGWLSVDPMMDKYPAFSSYGYCRWNPIKRIDVDGLFDTERQAQKAQDKAVKRFGSDRVGEIFNKGSEAKPDYSFHVYGYGKDNKTHENSDGVWAYRPAATISSKWGLSKYTFFGAERENKLSISISLGVQGRINLGNNGINFNLGSVDLVRLNVDMNNGAINDYYAQENNADASSGIGLGIGIVKVGYECNYSGGDYFDRNSISHSVKGNVIGIGTGSSTGNIEFGIGTALIFGADVKLTSTLRK